MARPLLSLAINSPFRGNQQPAVAWQNTIPPWQQKVNIAPMGLFPIPPVNSGILGATPQLQAAVNNARGFNLQGILGHKPENSPQRAPNRQWQQQPQQQQHQQPTRRNDPPSLLDSQIRRDSSAPRYPSSSPSSNRNQGRQEPRRDSQPQPPKNSSQQQKQEELEQKALTKEVPEDFYEQAKSKNLKNAIKFATVYSRKEFNNMKGLIHNENATGSGKHMCQSCVFNFLSRPLLSQHYRTVAHQELDEWVSVRNEQARLIIEDKILKPKDKVLEALLKAESEMNMKPTESELDPYILGAYESIMKAYWPVPRSHFYCRICNYVEFSSQRDFDRHNDSRDHVQNEDSYAKAFCLYCQVHNITANLMAKHERTEKHKETKALMEKTKECAIRRWHNLNKVPLPENLREKDEKAKNEKENLEKERIAEKERIEKEEREKSITEKAVNSPTAVAGNKRSAPQTPTNVNPAKKVAGKNDVIDLTAAQEKAQKSIAKNTDRTNAALDDKSKMWFAPITGYMCLACHTFLANEKEQAEHLKEGLHFININRFKKQLLNK